MSRPIAVSLLCVAIAAFTPADTHAGIYKCVADDGSLTYSQAPCPNQKSETVQQSKSPDANDPVDCIYAHRFAYATAQAMRGGTTSAQLFGRYGGLDSLSKGTISIVNYVYGYRSNKDVSDERIAALTQAKCRAKSLGDVSCEALPYTYTEQLGGCDPDAEAIETMSDTSYSEAGSPLKVSPAGSALQPSKDTQLEFKELTRARNEERRQRCEDSRQREIDSINVQMRSGYTSADGERYRERLRDLRKQLREC